MSSSSEVNPHDLTLSDLPSDFELRDGPTIDTTDEFPLPSLDLGEECDVDVLFPLEGEPTEEDLPGLDRNKAQEKPPHTEQWVQTPAFSPSHRSKADRANDENYPLPPLPSFELIKRIASEDDDYFEQGLELEDKPKPEPVEVKSIVPPPPPRLDDGLRASSSTEPSSWKADPALGKAAKAGSIDLSQGPKDSPQLTQPGAPMASLKSSLPTVESLQTKKSDSWTHILDEDELEPPQTPIENVSKVESTEPSSELYVRKTGVRKSSQAQAKLRPWVPAAGVALLAVAYFASKPLFAPLEGVLSPSPVLIIATDPKGEVFADDQSLGETPLTISFEQAQARLEIRKQGYRPMAVPPLGERAPHLPVQKFVVPLEASPVALSWEGLPQSATVWWNNEKLSARHKEIAPGRYSVKVKPADSPAVTVPLEIKPGQGTVAVGERVKQELAKQPKMVVGLSLPPKVGAKGLSLSVQGLDSNKDFSQKLTVSSDKKGNLTVPAAGKYKISFAGDESLKSASQTVELASGTSKDVSLALEKQAPKAAPVVVSSGSGSSYQGSGSGSGTGYRPYYPPPVYTGGGGSGGGGGGGRIAPPSF